MLLQPSCVECAHGWSRAGELSLVGKPTLEPSGSDQYGFRFNDQVLTGSLCFRDEESGIGLFTSSDVKQ